MTRKSSEKRSNASLAGWLFADLSIVLMILFASTSLKSDDLRCENPSTSVAKSPCKTTPTTSTIDPSDGKGGVRFQPIVVTINNVLALSPASFQQQIEREIELLATSRSSLQAASTWDYGVILIYGGAKGRADVADGDRIADEALKRIAPMSQNRWRKVRESTFFEPVHDKGVDYGSVKLKLFPIIS